MNNRITLTQTIDGYILFAQARRLSDNTISNYTNAFNRLRDHLAKDPVFSKITPQDIQAFLAGSTQVAKVTLLSYHIALSALWSWAVEQKIVPANILSQVPRPRPEKTAVIPMSEKEIKAIIEKLCYTRSYTRPGKRSARNKRPTADRDRAIVLLLLDTGLRASELCDLAIRDCDIKNRRVHVRNGKGDKERYIPFSARTATAIWAYLVTRKDDQVTEPLFATANHTALGRDRLLKMLAKAGERAEVPDVHPHRFRHTFAVNYLRNGGDIYTLQMILGHSSLNTVRIYLSLAQADMDAAHRRASPVENMRL